MSYHHRLLSNPTLNKAGAQATPVEALCVAYLQNPDLLLTIVDIQAAKDEVKVKEGKLLPHLDLQARKNLVASNDGSSITSAANVFEITTKFNLFNWFSDRAAVGQIIEKMNIANGVRNKACLDTRQLVIIA